MNNLLNNLLTTLAFRQRTLTELKQRLEALYEHLDNPTEADIQAAHELEADADAFAETIRQDVEYAVSIPEEDCESI